MRQLALPRAARQRLLRMSRRTEILRRATELFERQGVNQTSFEHIAQVVGIKREAIYYYFNSKEDILLEIILPQSRSLLMALRGVQAAAVTSVEKLQQAIRTHLNSYNPQYLEMTVMLRDQHFLQDQARLEELRNTWRQYNALWIELIEEGQATGEFNTTLDSRLATNGILGMCNWVSRWYSPSRNMPIEQIIQTFFTLCLHGLTAPPQAAAGTTTYRPDPSTTEPQTTGPAAAGSSNLQPGQP